MKMTAYVKNTVSHHEAELAELDTLEDQTGGLLARRTVADAYGG